VANDDAPVAINQPLALAARHILAPILPGEILMQLCREASALTSSSRALGSYVSSHQQWNDGIHVQLVGTTSVPVDPAHRSAAHAVYRQLTRKRVVVCLESAKAQSMGAIFRGLSVNENTPSSICGVPIYARQGRICGSLLIMNGTCPDEDVQMSLSFLCECASNALERARRFAAAKRDQDRLFVFSEATEEGLWDWDIETGEMWWGGAIQAIYRGDAIDVGQTLAWKEQRIPTQDRERVRASFAKALASTESRWQETYGFERADGTSAIVQDRAYILRDINGCPRRVVGRLLDITEFWGRGTWIW
jgi:PAS domain-containing protein